MTEELLSPARARGISRLLYVSLVFAAVLLLLAIPLVLGDYLRYGLIVAVIGLVLAGSGGLALRAVRRGAENARWMCITTGILQVVLSIPLVPIFVGLLTVVGGIGLLVVVLAPEHEDA
jgi:hypothetical protein